LIGFADYATPNRFELEWLAGQSASTVELAASAAASLGIGKVVVTSVSGADGSNIHNVLAGGEGVAVAAVKRRRIAAHGTGDLFAALFLAHLLNGASPETALRLATHGVDEVLDATGDAPELDLIATQARWAVFPQ
jgi:pyridoxine kinase